VLALITCVPPPLPSPDERALSKASHIEPTPACGLPRVDSGSRVRLSLGWGRARRAANRPRTRAAVPPLASRRRLHSFIVERGNTRTTVSAHQRGERNDGEERATLTPSFLPSQGGVERQHQAWGSCAPARPRTRRWRSSHPRLYERLAGLTTLDLHLTNTQNLNLNP
jgi:hypothetical protein